MSDEERLRQIEGDLRSIRMQLEALMIETRASRMFELSKVLELAVAAARGASLEQDLSVLDMPGPNLVQ